MGHVPNISLADNQKPFNVCVCETDRKRGGARQMTDGEEQADTDGPTEVTGVPPWSKSSREPSKLCDRVPFCGSEPKLSANRVFGKTSPGQST